MLETEPNDSELGSEESGGTSSARVGTQPDQTTAGATPVQATLDEGGPAAEAAAGRTARPAQSAAADPPGQDGTSPDEADTTQAPGTARKRRTTRTRRPAAKSSGRRAAGSGPPAPEQAGPDTAEAAAGKPAADAGAAAPEQPGAPLSSPFPGAATQADRDEDSPSPPDGSGAVPAATFQPPQVIFQPPASQDKQSRAAGPTQPGQAADQAGQAPAAETESADQPRREGDEEGTGRRRRRRGGRSRGRGGDGEQGTDGAASAEETAAEPPAAPGADEAAQPGAGEGADEDSEAGARRRRRRRRRGPGDADQAGPDEPPDTVVHVRPSRKADESRGEVQGVRGSTRLEAKRQRRREGRESGRRRPPVITESEFLARREAVNRVMAVRQRGDRTQIGVLEDGVLVEHYVDKSTHQSFVGNVYLGKVQNVLPSMEAAFVDIGKGRNAVLYAGEVNFDASGLEGESKRIESALKSGQSVLVQVTKDPVGHKGARLTSQVSLPGRYLVYVPGGSMMGISRKLPDKERTRLKQILKQVMPEGAGVIVRTAAEGASEEELSRDVARLSAQWESIEAKSRTASAPALLYSEPDLTIRVVRDIFNEDFSKLVVAGEDGWSLVDEYVRYVAPHLADRVERWQGEEDLFTRYRIDEQISKALERKVWLPSGGSLVIDKTEAMTVVDVNTGKFTGKGGNLEETVTRNNLEAAEEIVRQLRLRDIGGIIVIDFIDMVLESNRELVLRRLLECLARDRTKHQVAEVTSLGLVQMTRKRVGSGLLEAFSQPCECCNGRGVLVSLDLAPQEEGRPEVRVVKEGRPGRRVAEPAAAGDGEPQPAGKPQTPATPAAAEPAPQPSGGRRRRRASRDQGPPAFAADDGQRSPEGAGQPLAETAATERNGTSEDAGQAQQPAPGQQGGEPPSDQGNGTGPASQASAATAG